MRATDSDSAAVPTPSQESGVDYVLDALSAEGLTHLFMVPGGLVDPFLGAFARHPALRPIVAAHEGGATYMADGFARAGGRFGAALVIGGPGLCNSATAVAAAKTDASPVLVLSGEVPVAMEGLGAFQDASQATLDDTATMRPLTRLSATVVDPRTLGHWLRRAFATMWTQPQGPAHLSLTRDAMTGAHDAVATPVHPFFERTARLSDAAACAAIALLAQNARIAILAGMGLQEADDGAAALRTVAERWSLPVATTLRAKGLFPEDHPLSLGVFGYAGTRHATTAIFGGQLELLLVLGCGLNERDTMHWTLDRVGVSTIMVNADMAELVAHGAPGRTVLGDAHVFLARLLADAGADSALAGTRAQRATWVEGILAGPRLYDVENCSRSTKPIHPAAAITALREVFPREGILLVDSGAHRAFAGHYWCAFEPRTYVSATNLGPMGWAIPAAVGVACARPDRRVAVITGDGCMQMHGIEVQTAARYGLPIVYVVINNAALGNVWLRAHSIGPVPSELTSIPDHDWAGFARALGARGLSVEDPADLQRTFAEALAAGETVVIDVKADKTSVTPVYDFSAAVRQWSYHE